MATTTKENVLAIAPELASKVNSYNQQITLSFDDPTPGFEYVVAVAGIVYSFSAVSTNTVEDVVAHFNNELTTAGFSCVSSENKLVVTGVDYTPFNYVVSTGVSAAEDVVAVNNDTRFNLLLNDVELQVTEKDPFRFGVEQERAQRYLLAHLLTLATSGEDDDSSSYGDIKKETIGDISYTYATPSSYTTPEEYYNSTVYGRVFYSIQQRLYFRFI